MGTSTVEKIARAEKIQKQKERKSEDREKNRLGKEQSKTKRRLRDKKIRSIRSIYDWEEINSQWYANGEAEEEY